MIYPWKTLFLSTLLLMSGYTATELVTKSNPVLAQKIFPDLPADYWANPFIQKLAEINVVVGYPDGKFRPQQPIQRDEFAAMIHQAFEQKQIREISSASQFKDVPENHWAEMAIAEAYETGFMQTTGENSFSPNLPVSKTDAIVALTNGLKMLETERQDVATITPSVRKQPRVTKYRLAFPLASTVIMSSGMPLASTAILAPMARVNRLPSKKSSEPSALATVRTVYEDNNLIPEEAIDHIAVATKQGLVVNYPRPNYLEPNQLLDRGAATALIHQALVSIDKLPPLTEDTDASQYIVSPKKD